jgi:hypothetical protein
VIFAAETGSLSHGVSVETSDVDIKGFFRYKKE